MISKEQKQLLQEVERIGNHRYTNDVIRLGSLVNRETHYVLINDRGRLAIAGLEVGTRVQVSPDCHLASLHQGQEGVITAVDFHLPYPAPVYPLSNEMLSIGWEDKWGTDWEQRPKNDKLPLK